eukprot:1390294-Amphidinium_carterae.1
MDRHPPAKARIASPTVSAARPTASIPMPADVAISSRGVLHKSVLHKQSKTASVAQARVREKVERATVAT